MKNKINLLPSLFPSASLKPSPVHYPVRALHLVAPLALLIAVAPGAGAQAQTSPRGPLPGSGTTTGIISSPPTAHGPAPTGTTSRAPAGAGATSPGPASPGATSSGMTTSGAAATSGAATAGASNAGAGSGAGTHPASTASTDISVTVPDGQFLVWAVQGSQSGQPLLVTSKYAPVPAPGTGAATVWVVDPAQNRMATVSAAPGGAVTVKPTDLTAAYRLVVHVSDKVSGPLDYAQVTLTDESGHAQTETLTPEDGGEVVFHDVPFGKVTVAAARGDASTTTQASVAAGAAPAEITAALNAGSILPVSKPEAVASTTTGGLPAPAPHVHAIASPPPPNRAGGIIDLILGVLLAFAAVLLVFWIYRNPEAIHQALNRSLKAAGFKPLADMDADPAPAAPVGRAVTAAAADPSICAFCGTRKDPTTGACACTLVPASVAAAGPAATSTSPGPRLITVEGPARGQIFPLNGEATIGRDTNNTIPMPQDTAVSRRHARFVAAGGSVEVIDEGSSNGTFVNGSRVTRQALQPSDEVQIGHSRFRYEP